MSSVRYIGSHTFIPRFHLFPAGDESLRCDAFCSVRDEVQIPIYLAEEVFRVGRGGRSFHARKLLNCREESWL